MMMTGVADRFVNRLRRRRIEATWSPAYNVTAITDPDDTVTVSPSYKRHRQVAPVDIVPGDLIQRGGRDLVVLAMNSTPWCPPGHILVVCIAVDKWGSELDFDVVDSTAPFAGLIDDDPGRMLRCRGRWYRELHRTHARPKKEGQ